MEHTLQLAWINPFEAIILLVIVLVVFGAGKLPKVMEDLGRGVNAFKKGMNDTDAKKPDDQNPPA